MIQRMVKTLLMVTVLGLSCLGWLACAKKTYIDINYRLPAAADTLAGRIVYVESNDLRNDPEIFNKRAKAKFEHFTGLFALSLETPDKQREVLGAYDLPTLFETALKQRLQKLGIKITAERSPTVPVFQINLNQFRINLIGQKWVASTSFEAKLSRDSQRTAREVVSGSAERLKMVGSGGAEKVIGDIFTEMINRLDIERLYRQAEL